MNENLVNLVKELKTQGHEKKSKFLLELSKKLGRSNRLRKGVNVSKFERFCQDNETVVVPGKVLGGGILKKPVTVAAWNFSKEAEGKITKAGGKIMTINDLAKSNPKGTKVRIVL